MVNGIFDCWDGSSDTLVVCNFLIAIERDVEVDLYIAKVSSVLILWRMQFRGVGEQLLLTLIKTRLSLRSMSVIESLFERDMFANGIVSVLSEGFLYAMRCFRGFGWLLIAKESTAWVENAPPSFVFGGVLFETFGKQRASCQDDVMPCDESIKSS